MCREKVDFILRAIVKQLFKENDVTCTLLMESWYSGLRALEVQSKGKVSKKLVNVEELRTPIVQVEKDMFVLADDLLNLLEKASTETLPPKDDKDNPIKDAHLEDWSKNSSVRDEIIERRLTEPSRRIIETYAFAHIYSKIEVAHKEALSLKWQEDLIREEAVKSAKTEQKVKRGVSEKGKKLKKRQAVRALDSLDEISGLSNGAKIGKSVLLDSRKQSAESECFRKLLSEVKSTTQIIFDQSRSVREN